MPGFPRYGHILLWNSGGEGDPSAPPFPVCYPDIANCILRVSLELSEMQYCFSVWMWANERFVSAKRFSFFQEWNQTRDGSKVSRTAQKKSTCKFGIVLVVTCIIVDLSNKIGRSTCAQPGSSSRIDEEKGEWFDSVYFLAYPRHVGLKAFSTVSYNVGVDIIHKLLWS